VKSHDRRSATPWVGPSNRLHVKGLRDRVSGAQPWDDGGGSGTELANHAEELGAPGDLCVRTLRDRLGNLIRRTRRERRPATKIVVLCEQRHLSYPGDLEMLELRGSVLRSASESPAQARRPLSGRPGRGKSELDRAR